MVSLRDNGKNSFPVVGCFHRFLRGCPSWRRRQYEEKGRTLSGPRLRPDPASVTIDDALHRGQSNAGPGEFILPVETLKGAEEFEEACDHSK